MYTLVLMSVLSVGPDTAEFGGLFRRSQGCGSCQGSCYGSCSGTSYTCYGSCTGCNGSCQGSTSRFGSRIRAFFHRRESCYGSCTGTSYACTGCCGGIMTGAIPPMGYAAPAPAVSYGCPSCNSCPTCDSCPSVGVPLGSPAPVGDVYPSTPGTFTPVPPLPTTPGTTVPPATPLPAPPPPSVGENPGTTGFNRTTASSSPTLPGRATVVVRLPIDAKLYAEGQLLNLASAERSFVTPVLPIGGEYGYTFKAEYVRNGETITQTRRIGVRAGGSVNVDFHDLSLARRPVESPEPMIATAHTTASTESSPPTQPAPTPAANPFLFGGSTMTSNVAANLDRARLTVRIPTGATLYVDGRKVEGTDSFREFTTPKLPAGREFSYLMKAEMLRNGRPESTTQKVLFRAGEIVSVDFTNLAR